MKLRKVGLKSNIVWPALMLALFALYGCSSQKMVMHGFSFGRPGENTDVEILAYQYGENTGLPTEDHQSDGRPNIGQGGIVRGMFVPGTFLYARWRDKQTGRVYDERVDLSRVRRDELEGNALHFYIEKNKLYVVMILFKPHDVKGVPCRSLVGISQKCKYLYPTEK